jgi:hypothetical protein
MKRIFALVVIMAMATPVLAQSFSLSIKLGSTPLFQAADAVVDLGYSTVLDELPEFSFGVTLSASSNPLGQGFGLKLKPYVNYFTTLYSEAPISLTGYVYFEPTITLVSPFGIQPYVEPGLGFTYTLAPDLKFYASIYGDLYLLPSVSFYLSSFEELTYTLDLLKLKLGTDQYYLPSFNWDVYARAIYSLSSSANLTAEVGYGSGWYGYLKLNYFF